MVARAMGSVCNIGIHNHGMRGGSYNYLSWFVRFFVTHGGQQI